MNNIITVLPTDASEYNLIFENSFFTIRKNLSDEKLNDKKICIVTETNVGPLYLEDLKFQFKGKTKKICEYIFQAGEENKNLNNVQEIYKLLVENEFGRNDLLIALGGGVTGDMTGFVAATYMRGIDYIQVPTTLLSQVDSSIGGKTGVDFDEYKNMVGAFYQPRMVYMNMTTLRTLPHKEFSAGMAEVIKHAVIYDEKYLDWIEENFDYIIMREVNILKEMIQKSCLIKKTVVEQDPYEKNIRGILNFGHTIGHAIEKSKKFELLHGECVSLGMVGALSISEKLGYISDADMNRVVSLLEKFRLPVSCKNLNIEEVFSLTFSDKKTESGKIKFIYLEKLGKASIQSNIELELVKNAIKYLTMEK